MDLKHKLKFALLIGATSGLLGCKTPLTGMFGRGDSAGVASSPVVKPYKYDGISKEFAATAKKNEATKPLSGEKTSEGGVVSKAWKSTTGAVTSAFTSKPKTDVADDAVSLQGSKQKVGSDLYIAAARMLENQQKYPEAQVQYETALRNDPKNLTVLVSLARLHDRQGNTTDAIEVYQQARKAHPKSGLVHNDLGLCYARRQEIPQSLSMLSRAVELEPGKANYRNNLASVLVQTGRADQAYQVLAVGNTPAIAHYNLAYLLKSTGKTDQAVTHLQQALASDDSLTPARELLAELGGSQTQMASATDSQPAAGYRPFAKRPRGASRGQESSLQPGLQVEMPAEDEAVAPEPTAHIGDEGIETPTRTEGASLYQPTSYETDSEEDSAIASQSGVAKISAKSSRRMASAIQTDDADAAPEAPAAEFHLDDDEECEAATEDSEESASESTEGQMTPVTEHPDLLPLP